MEDTAGFRWLHATGMAHKEGDAEILLKLPDLLSQCGLRDVQLIRSTRHIARFDHPDEVFQLTQVHEI